MVLLPLLLFSCCRSCFFFLLLPLLLFLLLKPYRHFIIPTNHQPSNDLSRNSSFSHPLFHRFSLLLASLLPSHPLHSLSPASPPQHLESPAEADPRGASADPAQPERFPVACRCPWGRLPSQGRMSARNGACSLLPRHPSTAPSPQGWPWARRRCREEGTTPWVPAAATTRRRALTRSAAFSASGTSRRTVMMW